MWLIPAAPFTVRVICWTLFHPIKVDGILNPKLNSIIFEFRINSNATSSLGKLLIIWLGCKLPWSLMCESISLKSIIEHGGDENSTGEGRTKEEARTKPHRSCGETRLTFRIYEIWKEWQNIYENFYEWARAENKHISHACSACEFARDWQLTMCC